MAASTNAERPCSAWFSGVGRSRYPQCCRLPPLPSSRPSTRARPLNRAIFALSPPLGLCLFRAVQEPSNKVRERPLHSRWLVCCCNDMGGGGRGDSDGVNGRSRKDSLQRQDAAASIDRSRPARNGVAGCRPLPVSCTPCRLPLSSFSSLRFAPMAAAGSMPIRRRVLG